jgi:amino acid transporter
MASYTAFFWPPAASGWGRAATMSAVMVALTAVNLVGVRRAAGTATLLAVAKTLPLLLFVGLGLPSLDPAPFATAPLPDAGSFARSVLLLVFAFGGFEAVVVAAGEMQEPRRNMPFSLLVSIGGATLLYVLIQVVCVGTLPGLAASEKPLADAGVRFMGVAGASVIAAGALVSTVGTLCVILLVGPRVLFAISEQGQLPETFARTHRRFRTPHVAILITAGIGLALSISGTFTYLLGVNTIARLTAYLSTAAALLVFRRIEGDRPAAYSAPAGAAVATVAIAACAWLLSRSAPRELRDVGLAVAVGLCVFAADRWWRARGAMPVPARP